MKLREPVNLNNTGAGTTGGTVQLDSIAAVIREYSASGRLISERDLERRFMAQYRVRSGAQGAGFPIALGEALERHNDLHELTTKDGTRSYFSSQTMTREYASMLLQRHDDPLRLIAEVVRQNSAVYPRPVPLDMFAQPPIEMNGEQILDCLNRIATEEEYRDIASTVTSTSTTYLYSTLHLEPDHASMLAEWFDVGQFENP